MPAAKAIPAAVLDLALNDMKTATMVIYTSMTTNPADAAAITGVLLTRSGLVAGDFTVVSGVSIEVEAAAAAINAAASGTATCIILKTGTTATDGAIKGITTGSTVMTSGQGYIPSAHTFSFPAAA
jgi:hypothetical protein